MASRALRFRHVVVDPDPPGSLHDITLLGDINGDGRPEIIIGGKKGPPNLFWYENPTWVRHDMADAPNLEAGGVLVDITRNGRPDVVAGTQHGSHELYWFENPPDPTAPWPTRLMDDRFEKYHDQAVGDVDGDGEDEIVFLSQQSGVLLYYDIPADPRIQPWPRECCHPIAEGIGCDTEGLRVLDIDGDGVVEVVTGADVVKPAAPGKPCVARTRSLAASSAPGWPSPTWTATGAWTLSSPKAKATPPAWPSACRGTRSRASSAPGSSIPTASRWPTSTAMAALTSSSARWASAGTPTPSSSSSSIEEAGASRKSSSSAASRPTRPGWPTSMATAGPTSSASPTRPSGTLISGSTRPE